MVNIKSKLKSINLCRLIRVVSFLTILFLLLMGASKIFIPKSNKDLKGYNAAGIYGEPDNTIDYLVIGNSNVSEGFSPLDVWHNYGYTGYSCGEAWQTICGSYYMLKEFLSKQSPKIVILETDGLYEKKNMVGSIDKQCETAIQHFFPIIRYHNYWKKLTIQDLTLHTDYTWRHEYHGHSLKQNIDPFRGGNYMAPTENIDNISIQMEFYLNRFVSYCQKKGIVIILTSIPNATEWNMSRHNAVAQYANKHQIPYIDLNENYTDYGLDWKTDTLDGGIHLNCYGAQKATNIIGKYIHDNYPLPDHRNDVNYEQWNLDFANYDKVMTK